MRLISLSLALMLACAATASVQPAGSPSPQPAVSDEAAHDALRKLGVTVEAAMRDNKMETLAPLLSKDFHGVMVTGQVVNNVKDLASFWAGVRNLMGPGG